MMCGSGITHLQEVCHVLSQKKCFLALSFGKEVCIEKLKQFSTLDSCSKQNTIASGRLTPELSDLPQNRGWKTRCFGMESECECPLRKHPSCFSCCFLTQS